MSYIPKRGLAPKHDVFTTKLLAQANKTTKECSPKKNNILAAQKQDEEHVSLLKKGNQAKYSNYYRHNKGSMESFPIERVYSTIPRQLKVNQPRTTVLLQSL